MSGREEAEELMKVADRDLRALRGMLDQETFATEIFGFTAQQAVEKALKAWLCTVGQGFPFTHDIGELLALLDEEGQPVDELWDLDDLTAFAGHVRYAIGTPGREPFSRLDVIRRVELLHGAVRTGLAEG